MTNSIDDFIDAPFVATPDYEQLLAMGYTDITVLPNGDYACIFKFMFTYAILFGMNAWGYEQRWCYHSYEAARAALTAWDGEGDPDGWHRHFPSGRRRDEAGNEWIDF